MGAETDVAADEKNIGQRFRVFLRCNFLGAAPAKVACSAEVAPAYLRMDDVNMAVDSLAEGGHAALHPKATVAYDLVA